MPPLRFSIHLRFPLIASQNVGLQAKILSQRTFTIFVVMALVTTVTTTPLTTLLYPSWYQRKLESWKRGEIDWEGNRLQPEGDSEEGSIKKLQGTQIRRLLLYLRLESLPSLFTFITLLGGDRSTTVTKIHRSMANQPEVQKESSSVVAKRPLQVHGLRLLELTERTSSVMKVSEVDENTFRDPVVNAFRTFAQLNNVAASGGVAIVPESSYAETITSKASEMSSDLMLIPWSATGSMSEGDHSLMSNTSSQDRFSWGSHSAFVEQALGQATCNTAIFINRGFGGPARQDLPTLSRTVSGLSLRSHHERPINPIADRSHHIFFPFFGGVDDRVALRFVMQLAQNDNITATIVHFITRSSTNTIDYKTPEVRDDQNGSSFTPSSVPVINHHASALNASQDAAFLHTIRDSLPSSLSTRVMFTEITTDGPIAACVRQAKEEVGQSLKNAEDLIVLGRSIDTIHGLPGAEAYVSGGSEIRKTLGPIAELMINEGVKASVMVVQAAGVKQAMGRML